MLTALSIAALAAITPQFGAVGPAQFPTANGDGFLSITLDLTALPQPMGPVAPAPGSFWFFQVWYRDTQGGVPTSNFTDALAIVLQ